MCAEPGRHCVAAWWVDGSDVRLPRKCNNYSTFRQIPALGAPSVAETTSIIIGNALHSPLCVSEVIEKDILWRPVNNLQKGWKTRLPRLRCIVLHHAGSSGVFVFCNDRFVPLWKTCVYLNWPGKLSSKLYEWTAKMLNLPIHTSISHVSIFASSLFAKSNWHRYVGLKMNDNVYMYNNAYVGVVKNLCCNALLGF